MMYNSTNIKLIGKELNIMSIVRYVNKKTGVVSLYESTSHYDPETKQSRPVRKYLGREDPVTGELIPSTGKRGRKSDARENETAGKANEDSLRREMIALRKEIEKKDKLIASLESECMEYRDRINAIAAIAKPVSSK